MTNLLLSHYLKHSNSFNGDNKVKLTKETLKRIIKEELEATLDEVRTYPDPEDSNIPPEHLDKVHDLIATGKLNQAQSLVDAFGGDPNYVYNYKEYERVGDIEKLGAKIKDASSRLSSPRFTTSAADRKIITDTEAEIYRRAEEIAQRHLGDYRSLDDIEDQDEYDRMSDAILTQVFRTKPISKKWFTKNKPIK
mgnify:CR=1 FL=1